MTSPTPLRLADVAAHAGVSLATASRALRGLDGVSAEVAARVRQTAEDLGYSVNLTAQGLAAGMTSIAGLLVHQIDDPYFTEIAAGFVAAAEQRGLIVQVAHSGRDPQRELRQLRSMVAQRPRAVVIAGSGFTDEQAEGDVRLLLRHFADRGGRAAVIGRHNLGIDAILPDNQGAAILVAQHLVDLGHREVIVLSGPEWLTTVQDRLVGLDQVFTPAGVQSHLVVTDFTGQAAAQVAADAVRSWPQATAIVAMNDAMAIGAMSSLRRAGLSIPDDVSVVGVDDVDVAEMLYPALTTARFPLREIGRNALDLVFQEFTERPREVLVPAELVVRDSTAAPPRG